MKSRTQSKFATDWRQIVIKGTMHLQRQSQRLQAKYFGDPRPLYVIYASDAEPRVCNRSLEPPERRHGPLILNPCIPIMYHLTIRAHTSSPPQQEDWASTLLQDVDQRLWIWQHYGTSFRAIYTMYATLREDSKILCHIIVCHIMLKRILVY